MDSALPQEALRPRLATLALGRFLFALLIASAGLPPAATAGESPSDEDWRTATPFLPASEAIEAWLADAAVDPDRAVDAWHAAIGSAPRAARLGTSIRSLAASAEERLASPAPATPPEWIDDLGEASPSLRLAVAEELASHESFDACLAWLEGLEEETVYAPELLHYLRAVAAHQLVDDTTAREAFERLEAVLLENGEQRLGKARRWVFQQLARDFEQKPNPLSSVARRMADAERRLAMADPSKATREGQQTILDELDKLIDELEKQRQQQQQQAAAGGAGGAADPGTPAEDSRPSELKGPGEVDRKRLVAGDAWGALPPAERERLTQAITRDYPPHYRALVEDYFRTLAAEADRAATPESADR